MTKDCLKAVALFYGVTLILSGVGMAAYCLVAEQPFTMPADMPVVLDLRAFYLTAGLIMPVGLGSVLLWAGLASKTRTRIVRVSLRLGRTIRNL
jgi:hypothetical protein